MTLNQNRIEKKSVQNTNRFLRAQLQKDSIIDQLKASGCRITKQRLLLLDVILENECSSSKEIYYKASSIDKSIGTATVYRMINKLEEVGAINRKNMYKLACSDKCEMEDACKIELDDDTVYHFSAKNWYTIVREGLKACGYLDHQNIQNVTVQQCECDGEACR